MDLDVTIPSEKAAAFALELRKLMSTNIKKYTKHPLRELQQMLAEPMNRLIDEYEKAHGEESLLAHDPPEMPEDWLPDKVTVIGEHDVDGNKVELGFLFRAEFLSDPDELMAAMEGLRLAIWECVHAKPEFWVRAREKNHDPSTP